MKQKVSLSAYSLVLSVICLIVLIMSLYYCRNNWGIYPLGATIIIWILLALYYMPLSISVDDSLNINRSLRIKSIPLSEIKKLQLSAPTMAERRIFGSGGFFGYWGWFSEPSVGKYFACYGKASDCFLVELKNGKKYMLSCDNAPAMVEFINKHIEK